MGVKVDIVLGFLGSGKTTLINLFLKSGEIENELVVIILYEKGKKEIVEKSKNIIIIYTEDSESFDKNLLNLILRKYMPDRILIEYNGYGATDKFIDSFNNKYISRMCNIDKVINVIDSRRAGLYFRNINRKIESHIKNSDIVILNNLLDIDKKVVKDIKRYINEVNKAVRVIEFIDEGMEEKLINNRGLCLDTTNEKLSSKELFILIIVVFLFIIIILTLLLSEEVVKLDRLPWIRDCTECRSERTWGWGCISFEGLSRMKDSTECRNAEVSELGDEGVSFLRDYLKSKIF